MPYSAVEEITAPPVNKVAPMRERVMEETLTGPLPEPLSTGDATAKSNTSGGSVIPVIEASPVESSSLETPPDWTAEMEKEAAGSTFIMPNTGAWRSFRSETPLFPENQDRTLWEAANTPLANIIPKLSQTDADAVAKWTDATGIPFHAILQQTIGPEHTAQLYQSGQHAAADLVNYFTSPIGLGTLGAGALPKVAQKAIGLAFAAHTLKNAAPEQITAFKHAKTFKEKADAAFGLLVSTGIILGGGKHGLAPERSALPRTPATTVAPNGELSAADMLAKAKEQRAWLETQAATETNPERAKELSTERDELDFHLNAEDGPEQLGKLYGYDVRETPKAKQARMEDQAAEFRIHAAKKAAAGIREAAARAREAGLTASANAAEAHADAIEQAALKPVSYTEGPQTEVQYGRALDAYDAFGNLRPNPHVETPATTAPQVEAPPARAPAEGADAASAVPAGDVVGSGIEAPKTRLDLLLDGVERTGKELTIEVTDANRDNLTRIIDTAKDRGLDASTDGRFVLVRKLSAGTGPASLAGDTPVGRPQAEAGGQDVRGAAEPSGGEAPGADAPSEKPKRIFRRKIPEAPGGSDAITRLIDDIGKLKHPETARQEALHREGKMIGATTGRGGEYDPFTDLTAPLRSLIFREVLRKQGETRGGLSPDEAAQAAYEQGLIRDPSPDTLAQALKDAWTTRLTHEKASKAAEKEMKAAEAKAAAQTTAFETESKQPQPGSEKLAASDLNVGDVVEVNGETMKVTEVDPEENVTLEDGSRYGVQEVKDGDFIYGEIISKVEVDPLADWPTLDTPEKTDGYIDHHQLAEQGATEAVPFVSPPPAVERAGQADSARAEGAAGVAGGEVTALPKLRRGEQQGDLLSTQTEDLTLVGETGVDTVKRAEEAAQREKDAAEAKALQDKQQLDIFAEPSPSKEAATPTQEPPTPSKPKFIERTEEQKVQMMTDAYTRIYEMKARVEARENSLSADEFEQSAMDSVDSAIRNGREINWSNIEKWAGSRIAREAAKRGEGLDKPLGEDTETTGKDMLKSPEAGPVENAAASDLAEVIDAAIERLPETERFIWRETQEGSSDDAIANALGITEGSVRTLRSRAKGRLQEMLKDRQSISDTIPSEPISRDELKGVVATLRAKFKGAAETAIVTDGSLLPPVVLDAAKALGVDPNRIGGVYHDGVAWLNAAALDSPGRAVEVWFHEQWHARGSVLLNDIKPSATKRLETILKREFKAEWEYVAGDEKTGIPARYRPHEWVDETLARIMEKFGPEAKRPAAWQRVVDYIRTILAKAGLKQWSRADIEALLRRGLERIRSRRESTKDGTKLSIEGERPKPPIRLPRTPLEARPEMLETTAAYNAHTDAELAAAGLEPIAGPARKVLQQSWDEALALTANDTGAGDRLVGQLNAKPFALNDVQSGVLLKTLADRKIQFSRAQQALFRASEAGDGARISEASARLTEARDAVYDVISAAKKAGTEWGRAGRFRQIHIDEDYSIEAMEARMRDARGGKAFDPADPKDAEALATIAAQAKEIEALKKRAEAAEQSRGDVDALEILKRVQEGIKHTRTAKAAGKSLADHLKERGIEALQKLTQLREKQVKFSISGKPTGTPRLGAEELALHAEYGSSLIAGGARSKAEFATQLEDVFGAQIRPHVEQIFEAAKEQHAIDRATYNAGRTPKGERTPAEVVATANKDRETPPEGEAPEELNRKTIYDLVRAHVAEDPAMALDKPKMDELMATVAEEVQQFQPGITPNEVRDILVDYGKTQFPSKEQLSKKMAEVTGAALTLSKLERALQGPSGEGVTNKGSVQQPPTSFQRGLMKELVATMRRMGVPTRQLEGMMKTAHETRVTRLKNSLEDVQRQIETRQRTPDAPEVPWTPEELALKDQVSEMRSHLDSILNEPDSDEIASVLDRIEKVTTRLASGNIAPKGKSQNVPTRKLAEAREKLTALNKELAELRKAKRLAENPPKTPEERYLESLERRNKAARDLLASGKLFREPGKPTPTSPAIEAARKELHETNALLKEARKASAEGQQRALDSYRKAIERRTREYEDRLVRGDFARKPKKPRPEDDTLIEARAAYETAKHAFDRAVFEQELANRTGWEKARDRTLLGLQSVRGIVLGSDIGVLTRQGLFAWSRPVTALKATGTAFRAAVSPKSMAKWEVEVRDRKVDDRSAAPLRKQAGLQMTDTLNHPEELVVTRLLSRLPDFNVGGKTIQLSKVGKTLERFQTTFINAVRADLFDTAIKQGMTPEELRLRANFINSSTGRSNIKHVPRAMSVIFTSPRYEASRWEMLTQPARNLGALARKGVRGELDKAALANLQDMAVTLAGIYTLYKLAEIAGGYSVTWDPTSSDFLKMRKGDDVWDVSAGLAPRLRDLMRMYVALTHPSYKDNLGKVLLGSILRTINPAIKTPIEQGSVAAQRLRGEEEPNLPFSGFRSDEERDGWIALAPLIVQSTQQALKDGPGQAAFTAVREFVGSSVNRYPEKPANSGTSSRQLRARRL